MEQLIRYMQDLVLGARGNVVSFTLRQAKRALGAKSKSEEATLRAALEALVRLGLLRKVPGKKPRYILQRGSPLWSALERGCIDLLLDGRFSQTGRASRTRNQAKTSADRYDKGRTVPAPRGAPRRKARPLK